MVSATAGAARSAVAGSFQTCLAEHRARATGVSRVLAHVAALVAQAYERTEAIIRHCASSADSELLAMVATIVDGA